MDPTGALRSPPFLVLGWASAGALLAVGLGAAFTPLILLTLPAAALGLLLGLRAGSGRAAWAVLSGAAVVPLWIAWSDRGGPGEVCTGTVDSDVCTTTGSPWWWAAAGLAMLVVGLVAAHGGPRRRSPQKA